MSDKAERPDPFAAPQGDAPEKPFPPEEIAARPAPPAPEGVGVPDARAGRRRPARSGSTCAHVFPVDRPGRYRLEISFDDLKAADGSQGQVASEFGVSAASERVNRPIPPFAPSTLKKFRWAAATAWVSTKLW